MNSKFFLFLIFLLLIFSGIITYKYINLQKNYYNLVKEYKQNYSDLESKCNSEISNLINNYKILKQNYIYLDSNYELLYKQFIDLNKKYYALNNYSLDLKDEIKDLLVKLNEYKNYLNSVQKWYSENAFVDNSKVNHVLNECLNNCSLNLGCLAYYNKKELGLTYVSDFGDHLESINEFLKKKEGDCEEFSFLFRAELNLAKTKCDHLKFKAYTYNKNSKFLISKNIYIKDAKEVNLKGKKFYVVCGKYKQQGHCMVMISDINFDSGAIIEPQTGAYLGNLNKEFVFGKARDNYIDLIISNSDFYRIVDDKIYSINYFLNEIEKIKSDYNVGN